MKALFYSPYLHILGGGERHLFNFATCLAKTHQVYLVCRQPKLIKLAETRFGIDLSRIELLPFLPARFALKEFDLLFFVSDGSIPFLPVSQSVLFFMSPFQHVRGRSLINQIKLKFINRVICNSHYTKKFIDQEFGVDSKVIYPAIQLPKVMPKIKENIILSVGRFSRSLHDKSQAVLIKTFINLEPQLPDWKLVLAGGTETGSESILPNLRRLAGGHRIDIKTDISATQLRQDYAQAKIYWHAAGYGSNLKAHPEKAEHFGISIAEAMSHGAVPIVFAAGGPTEIVTPESGMTWSKLTELPAQTLELVNKPQLVPAYSRAARRRAEIFSQDNLCRKFHSLLH